MDDTNREAKFTIVATVLIIVGLITGLGFFLWHTKAILTIACVIILPFLPFYFFYRHCQNTKRLTSKIETEGLIEAYAEELECLVSDIEDYDSKKDDEPLMEYLDGVKEEISSVVDGLKDLHASLIWKE